MLGDLFINSNDAWGTYRVAMGESFIQNLLTPAGNKDFKAKAALKTGRW